MTPPALSRGEKTVLLAMQSLADDEGYTAPSAAVLAARSGYGPRQAANIKAALVDKGALVPAGFAQCPDVKGVTMRQTPRYRLSADCWPAITS